MKHANASDATSRLRVLIVINQLSIAGGAEVSLREQLAAMADRDDVIPALAVLRPSTTELGDLPERGVSAYLPGRKLGPLSGVPHLVKAVRDFAPDVVHTTLADANTSGRIAAKLCGVPSITSLVNTPYAEAAYQDRDISQFKHGIVRLVDRVLGRYATSAFHAITDVTARHAVEVLSIPPGDVHVVRRGRDRVRLGVKTVERRLRVRHMLGLGSEPVILNIGRQVPQKGQRYLVEAMPRVWERYPDAKLLIAGRVGDASPDLLVATEVLAAGDQVQILGERSDVGDLLSAADVFAFPSLYEGLGGSLLEAMALEVPIVAAASPAAIEVLAGGILGLLVDVADADSLAEGLLSSLAGGPEVSDRVARARHSFDHDFSIEASVNGLVELYQDVTSSKVSR